ncbi:MAG: PIN domain-containing protein [Oscillospiraceae bacterium]|nr:PIN domain-containing protein [Oscillospiraceae bacterium]
MSAKAFLDTNILLYPFDSSNDGSAKGEVCLSFYGRYNCCTSIQALHEFCFVCTNKWKQDEAVVAQAVEEIRNVCHVGMVTLSTLYSALHIRNRYRYRYFDCLMLASALEFGCEYFISEDLAHGQVIDGRLTITNPFA